MRQPIPLLKLFIPLTRKRFPYLTQLYSPSRDAAPAPSYFIMHVTGIDGKVKEANDEPSATAHPLKEMNSKSTESYHSWSSNGRWVVFSSRRYDGNYTRPFFAHIDKDGKASKPFELPCADPDYHRQFLRSYNIPEFMHGPVTISPQNFADALKLDGEPVKYVQQLSK